MGLALTVETWVLSIFGWVWLTVQNIWMPSLLSSYVYYGFLLISTWHLMVCALFVDARQPRVAYFNFVLGFCLFTASCIADTFTTYTFGGEKYKPVHDLTGCCANCDIAKANQILFFGDTKLYLAPAGMLVGYLLVHFILAGAQVLLEPSLQNHSASSRTVWTGSGWGITLAALVSARCVIMFDGSTVTLIPESVFYLLLFSQPLMTLSVIYWLFAEVFLVLMILDGIPQLTLTGLRIVRSVILGVTLGFTVVTAVVFGMRGMLTLPMFVTLCVVLLSSVLGMLEAFLGRLPEDHETADRRSTGMYLRRPPTAVSRIRSSSQRTSVVTPGTLPVAATQRMSKHYIPVPIQMPPVPGKKAV